MDIITSSRAQRGAVPSTGMRGGLGRTLLTAFLILAIGPLSLIGYVAFSQVRAGRQDETTERLTAITDLHEGWLRDWLSQRQANLADITRDPACADWLAKQDEVSRQKVVARLKATLDKDATFSEVFLVTTDSSERWLAATTGQVSPRPQGATSPRENPRTAVRLASSHAGEPVLSVMPVRGDSPDALRVVAIGLATLNVAPGSLPTGSLKMGRGSIVYLINRDNQTLVLQSTRPVSSALSMGASRALAGQSGTATYKNAAGVAVIGVYRWLDDLELALVAEQDQAEAFARSDELAAGLIGMVLGVALLTTIIAAVVTRRITRPIVLLTEAAIKMSGGDLSVRVQPTRRDEIGILGNVFNTMASELAGLYAGLEQKVAERTREVQQAKEQIQYHAWQLSISAEIGRITTSILDLDTLLTRASELIRDAFQLDHVGVYLLDHSGHTAQLCSSVGRGVPIQEHELRMSSVHPIVSTISQRTPHSLARSGTVACHELVLPLALGAQTIGALDLTTCDPAGFSESDQSVLQTLAGQLSVAIENARTYSQEHEAADEMREIDRLRGQFLMRMSHQLATYLNTILGFSKLMLKGVDGPLNETQAKDMTAIRQSGQQLARLLDDILELADLEVGTIALHHAPLSVAELVNGLRSGLGSILVNPQTRLEMQIEPELPEITADADRLKQVLTNLVMTASEICHEGIITVQAARKGNQVMFQVSVPGVAVGQAGNHAISLALSRKLVDLHGGRLQVEQHAGNVTAFCFGLPLSGGAQVTRIESDSGQETA